MTGSAKQSIATTARARKYGLLRRFAPRNDVKSRHSSTIPRRDAPESCVTSCPPKRAWGTPGARCTRSLACESKKHTSIVTTGPPDSPGVPTHNGFNGLFRALPGDRAFLSPSPAEMNSADLTPASRRQDHTTSPSASARFVKRASASTASRPALMTLRNAPRVGQDGGSCRSDLPDGLSEIFFQMGLDRKMTTDLPVG
jgi:hypothetical protein